MTESNNDRDELRDNSVLVFDRLIIAAKSRCEGFDVAIDTLREMAAVAFNKHDDPTAHKLRDIVRMLNISHQRKELGDALIQAIKDRDAIT